ncbi:hypothetical protein V8C35DRAFT_285844 [Trichoderma chlorosporum]
MEMGGGLERNVTLLSTAPLLCAALTRDYRASHLAFFMNMAAGIVLSTAKDWKELYACCRLLGLDVQSRIFALEKLTTRSSHGCSDCNL